MNYMKMHRWDMISIALLFCLCSCNMSDSVQNLSGGYQFAYEGKDNATISNSYNEILANVTGYNFNDDFIIVEQQPNRQSYRSSIGFTLGVKYGIYQNKIRGNITSKDQITKRTEEAIFKDTALYRILEEKGMSTNNGTNDRKIGLSVADSILNTDPRYIKLFSLKRAYWIITLNNDTLMGPMTKEEYKQKRKELNVPNNLQIRPADD